MVVTRGQASSLRRLQLEPQQANMGFLKVEVQGNLFLPGIPNEVTLQWIIPKLSWKDFYALSSVSPCWHDAILSRRIYDERVQSQSTETLHLVSYERRIGDALFPAMALFSMRDQFCKELPPLPHLDRPGIPMNCRFVSLDGKLYVLGGITIGNYSRVGTNRVYVLDLAGQREWKECARMQYGRQDFGCGVLGGKIYVFGCFFSGPVVYDPKENTWSPIRAPTISLQDCKTVAVVGEEFFLFKKSPYYPLPLRIYHPAKDEWRELTSFVRRPRGTVFTVQGRLYVLSYNRLHVLDIDENSWTELQSCSFAGCGVNGTSVIASMDTALTVDDEILAVLIDSNNYKYSELTSFLVRSRGFGSETEEITWERVQFDIPFSTWGHWRHNFMCTVQL